MLDDSLRYGDKGYNVDKLRYVPSEFKDYRYNSLTLKDLSFGQVTNLSVAGRSASTSKLMDIYSSCFLDKSIEEQADMLLIDYVTVLHYINHLSFGAYDYQVSHLADGKKPVILSYSLYDISFSEPKKRYAKDKYLYNGIEVEFVPFTVSSMIEIEEAGLGKSESAYLAMSIKRFGEIYFSGAVRERLSMLEELPIGFRESVSSELQEYYPRPLPLELSVPGGGTVTILPEVSMKGLPYFT